ncbi:ATP-binding protein [Streptomyces sp. NPDC046866]|uniref:ATP-binding protein n=1 Tax=Streptomyces sp. NPDC046866 TaxID=3154921 RepID=UPI003451685B
MDRTQGQAEPVEQSTAAGGPHPASASTPVARIATLTAGDYTLTVNPVDGSEIAPRRPGTGAARPAKRDAASRRAAEAALRPPALPGSAGAPRTPLLARDEERARLVRLLSRGRSVRLTGPAGSGRTALLDAVAADCAGLAPDGVVRLSGHGHQQPGELLHTLYGTVFEASSERPDRIELLARVRDIGAIVLLDDLELGPAALDELLRATPECAYVLAGTAEDGRGPDDAALDEVVLGGLGRADCRELLEARLGRPLTDEETAWAEDLRFASDGLPLRFVQAAALLRRRDELNRAAAAHHDEDEDEPGVFEERPRDAAPTPMPTLAEGAAPAELLAARVSESARAALRIACALGGELPHPAHLPALVGDTHADAAVAELLAAGLITPVGPRYRLAAGVARQLEEAGYGDTAAEEARTAARHYAWWTGHASVTPERIAAEADAVLAALAGADVVAAVLLARTAAPAFAASRQWEAWGRVLRAGAEAARKAGEVAEQAYFHHELGVLALCEGRLGRARAELEASIGLKGALADKRGTVAGRRALALVTDREAAGAPASPPLRLAAPAEGAPAKPAPAKAAPLKPAPVKPAPVKAAPVKAAPVKAAAEGATTPLPVAPAGSEAATTAVPVIRRAVAPSSLSEVFEDAFPLDPKPTPAAGPAPAPASAPAWQQQQRRKPVLLAVAGALTVAVLGTVIGLAMSSSDSEGAGSGPATSSTPAPAAPDASGEAAVPGVPGGGNDSAPQPGAGSAEPSEAAEPGQAPGTTPSPGGPSRRPSSGASSPTGSTPTVPSGPASPSHPTTPSTSPSPSQSPSTSPTATATVVTPPQ